MPSSAMRITRLSKFVLALAKWIVLTLGNSCIAITGLAGHAFGSWKERGGEHMWLRDSLRRDLPGTRVLTYGYNSELAGSDSFQGIEAIASGFVGSLRRIRQVSRVKN
jgi:hypothetical protein